MIWFHQTFKNITFEPVSSDNINLKLLKSLYQGQFLK